MSGADLMSKKILVAYYSHSGNTKKIAQTIHEKVPSDILEIQPAQSYPQVYETVVQQAKKEIQAGFRPQLQEFKEALEAFDVLYIGSPNWWYTIAPPVASFLEKAKLEGKTVIPFITHGGGGLANCFKDIKSLCPGANVLEALNIYQGGSSDLEKQITAWLERLDKQR